MKYRFSRNITKILSLSVTIFVKLTENKISSLQSSHSCSVRHIINPYQKPPGRYTGIPR